MTACNLKISRSILPTLFVNLFLLGIIPILQGYRCPENSLMLLAKVDTF